MKISYVAVMRWKPDSEEPVLLGSGADLSDYSFFQRGSIKEFMLFTSKTVARKTQVGARQTVKAQGYMCHVVVRNSHLAAAVVCDQEYPSRAAMSVAMQTIADFESSGNTAWKTAEADTNEASTLCEQAVIKYKVCSKLLLSLQAMFVQRGAAFSILAHACTNGLIYEGSLWFRVSMPLTTCAGPV